ncbi:hypothetical protein [Bacteriovorax sp. Seq25_V]|uniref:hypothetical protein n=1 Tax=Bacteriovorax sp. Seq25_V TaxID=1201288 RepID=UPI00038A03C4|nr:hypothetical protein [Bacteriovorax sp. Seq25_V]EQC47263.1 hypothetical protein M900_0732 [Bacteriovorax sp. Seq25_V]
MSRIKFILVAFFVAISAFGAVNKYHAMNVFKGDYKFKNPQTGNDVLFSITNKGEITLLENDDFYNAKVEVQSLGNNLGPDGLSVMTVMLAGGSDEQTMTTFIRLYPVQIDDKDSVKVAMIDAIQVENDGPNGVTFLTREKIKLYKKLKNSDKYFAVGN